jgi:hypothetical protein
MHFFAQQDTQASRLLFILTSFRDVAVREQATRDQQSGGDHAVFQRPPQPPLMNESEPMSNIFGPNNNNSNYRNHDEPHTPSSLNPAHNRSSSNPQITSPLSYVASLGRNVSYPSNGPGFGDHHTPCNSSHYSLDNFLDLDRHQPFPSHSTANSESNDSLGENAEIDFEMLWRWPSANGLGVAPGVLGAGNGGSGEALGNIGGITVGLVQGVSDSSVPLFGLTSEDF